MPFRDSTGMKAGRSESSANSGEVISPLSLERRQKRSAKRDRYFLKGPISFGWIRVNIPDPTSRVILVATAFMEMRRSDECALTAKIWDCAGVVDRYQRRRVLARLREVGGHFKIEDRIGRSSVMRRASIMRDKRGLPKLAAGAEVFTAPQLRLR